MRSRISTRRSRRRRTASQNRGGARRASHALWKTHMSAKRQFWIIAISSALILAVTMGIRNALGLFVSPLNTSSGLGIVSISFALAVGQFVWGAAQPIFGALADRAGSVRIIAIGAVLLALGLAVTPFMHSKLGLIFFLGVVAAAGAGGGSFSILIGA
ncbi:MAG: MFS transporter, partial [Burkholderiales bacterium]|nr:MFS transporter [Burkholderiales bacterium]